MIDVKIDITGLKCPQCKENDRFMLHFKARAHLVDGEVTSISDVNLNEYDDIRCGACGINGTIREFRTNG